MHYTILGVHIHRRLSDFPKVLSNTEILYDVRVAWQSNHPNFPFLWRCTQDVLDHLPTEQDIQQVAAKGTDDLNKPFVRKLFPFLPGKALSD